MSLLQCLIKNLFFQNTSIKINTIESGSEFDFTPVYECSLSQLSLIKDEKIKDYVFILYPAEFKGKAEDCEKEILTNSDDCLLTLAQVLYNVDSVKIRKHGKRNLANVRSEWSKEKVFFHCEYKKRHFFCMLSFDFFSHIVRMLGFGPYLELTEKRLSGILKSSVNEFNELTLFSQNRLYITYVSLFKKTVSSDVAFLFASLLKTGLIDEGKIGLLSLLHGNSSNFVDDLPVAVKTRVISAMNYFESLNTSPVQNRRFQHQFHSFFQNLFSRVYFDEHSFEKIPTVPHALIAAMDTAAAFAKLEMYEKVLPLASLFSYIIKSNDQRIFLSPQNKDALVTITADDKSLPVLQLIRLYTPRFREDFSELLTKKRKLFNSYSANERNQQTAQAKRLLYRSIMESLYKNFKSDRKEYKEPYIIDLLTSFTPLQLSALYNFIGYEKLAQLFLYFKYAKSSIIDSSQADEMLNSSCEKLLSVESTFLRDIYSQHLNKTTEIHDNFLKRVPDSIFHTVGFISYLFKGSYND
jgi:hypothetical protein